MATNPLSPDGKWMLTPDGWVYLDSDPSKTPDGQWNFTNGRFVDAQHIADEYIDGPVHLARDVPNSEALTQTLVSTKDSVIMGDVNVTVNQGPSMDEIHRLIVDLLNQTGASIYNTPTNISEEHRKLLSERIDAYDQLRSEGAESDPSTELVVATAANVKGDYDDARRRLAEILQQYPDSTEANDAIQLLAQISIRLSDWVEAEKYVKQAMLKFETSGNWEGMVNTYNQHAVIHAENGQHERALEMYKEAVEIAKRRNLPGLHARSLANRGFLLNQVGRISEAKNALGESLQLARAVNNTSSVIMITKELSEIYASEGDTVNASHLLRQSRKDLGDTDDKYILAERELLDAELLEKRKNFRMARSRYVKAERMFSEIGVKSKQGDVCIALAALDDEAENYTSAIGWYTKALDCFRDPPKPADRMFCFAELGNLYLMTKDHAESIKCSSMAIDLATQLDDLEQQLHCLLTLCSAQYYLKDIVGARNTLSAAKKIADNHALEDERFPRLDAMLANTQR